MTQLTILGLSFLSPSVYSAGHPCTASEAQALNRLLTRSMAKGLHRILSQALTTRGYESAAALSEDDRREVLALAEEYIQSFALGFSQGHERLRSIEIEAKRIAYSALEARLYKQGKTMRDVPEAEREILLTKIVALNEVQEEARTRVDDVQRIAKSASDSLLDGDE